MGERAKFALGGRQGVGRGTHNRLSFYALFLNPSPLNHKVNLAFLHFTTKLSDTVLFPDQRKSSAMNVTDLKSVAMRGL